MAEVKALLRKLEFPAVVVEALGQLQKILGNFTTPVTPSVVDLANDILEEFIFAERRRKKLSSVRELHLLDVLCNCLQTMPREAARNVFFVMFPPSDRQLIERRMATLTRLVSLAVTLNVDTVLDCAAFWIHVAGINNDVSLQLSRQLLRELFDGADESSLSLGLGSAATADLSSLSSSSSSTVSATALTTTAAAAAAAAAPTAPTPLMASAGTTLLSAAAAAAAAPVTGAGTTTGTPSTVTPSVPLPLPSLSSSSPPSMALPGIAGDFTSTSLAAAAGAAAVRSGTSVSAGTAESPAAAAGVQLVHTSPAFCATLVTAAAFADPMSLPPRRLLYLLSAWLDANLYLAFVPLESVMPTAHTFVPGLVTWTTIVGLPPPPPTAPPLPPPPAAAATPVVPASRSPRVPAGLAVDTRSTTVRRSMVAAERSLASQGKLSGVGIEVNNSSNNNNNGSVSNGNSSSSNNNNNSSRGDSGDRHQQHCTTTVQIEPAVVNRLHLALLKMMLKAPPGTLQAEQLVKLAHSLSSRLNPVAVGDEGLDSATAWRVDRFLQVVQAALSSRCVQGSLRGLRSALARLPPTQLAGIVLDTNSAVLLA